MTFKLCLIFVSFLAAFYCIYDYYDCIYDYWKWFINRVTIYSVDFSSVTLETSYLLNPSNNYNDYQSIITYNKHNQAIYVTGNKLIIAM